MVRLRGYRPSFRLDLAGKVRYLSVNSGRSELARIREGALEARQRTCGRSS